ncbi:hypothetical protein QU481_02770 [Crenobacter sp. SG2303]|uniref:Uncharacterized protein n=1 Tax=Crenobacter oryzisoli TaxID=3056844 RepID=A0ABT7XJ66_9NEIS|nr:MULTISPECIES: hypothetical protein [unclassified Crenobacter]MDN0073813.1 hypothetical protein [Crenobacter sp. SG2303]MDN0084816.1 hypothetical protein [Crenobacter sp. SG2305]
MDILHLLNQADYIQVNNQFVSLDFRFDDTDFADDDDVALQARVEGQDLVLTVGELEEATPLADGGFWLEGVGYLRFLSRAGLH